MGSGQLRTRRFYSSPILYKLYGKRASAKYFSRMRPGFSCVGKRGVRKAACGVAISTTPQAAGGIRFAIAHWPNQRGAKNLAAIFSRGFDGKVRNALVGLTLGTALFVGGFYYYAYPQYTRVGYQPEQP